MSMLLTCCFRDQNSAKKGSRSKKREEENNASSPGLRKKNVDGHYLIAEESRKSNGSTVHSATLRSSSQLELKLGQERHPPSKEAKRLLKQRSHESFKNEETARCKGIDWTNHRASIPYIDQSPQESVPPEYKLQYADNRSPDKRASTTSIATSSNRNSLAGLVQSSPCPTYPLPPHLLPAEAWSTGSPPIHSSTPLPPYPSPPGHSSSTPLPPYPSPPVHSSNPPSQYSIPRRQDEEPVSLSRPDSTNCTPRGQRPQESADFPATRSTAGTGGQRPETAESGTTRGQRPEQTAESAGGRRKSSADSRKSSSHSLRQLQLSAAEETPVFRGLQRSTAFHDAALLQEQIRAEEAEKANEREREERVRSALREEFNTALQAQAEDHDKALEKVRGEQAAQLQRVREEHQRELHRVLTKSKNEENERISLFNQSLENERQQFQRLEDELRRKHREAIFQKDADIKMAQYEVEARDKHWQEEKAEVLAEVQRLKAECRKMVSLLAQEIEEEALSENRKMSLSQEAASLHLVLEMRNQEVRSLREKAATLQHRLEKFENVQEELKKARARVEDLEEQIKLKDKLEKQLSYEKTELEQSVERNTKVAVRMSQNVEELQWRIRNNFDLPLSVCSKSTSFQELEQQQQQQPASLPDLSRGSSSHTPPHHRPHSTPLITNNSPARSLSPAHMRSPSHSTSSAASPLSSTHRSAHRHSMFAVSEEMMEATTSRMDEGSQETTTSSDLSPCSEGGGGQTGSRGAGLEPLGEEAGQEDSDRDSEAGASSLDSLDEGLGDINCENETAESPQPRKDKPEAATTSPPLAALSSPEETSRGGDRTELLPKLILASGLGYSDNRLPSRISFQAPM